MTPINFFPPEQIIGVFRGFREGGLEFHADLVLPYRNEFQSIPMHGQFLLVQLESPDEAVLGRIASLSSDGKLAGGSGEEFSIRALQEGRAVPEDIREQYLKYRVNIRVLGVLRGDADGQLTFVPSHRRLPHVGSPVAFPSAKILQEIAGHAVDGAAIGHFALGEYIYAAGSEELEVKPWMQVRSPEVLVKFPIENLVARRSFIFARAGFGKSNLNKLLFSTLYQSEPTVEKRGGRRVPVGTVIFDPDGEYFWPDDRGRPGLCDVEALRDKVVVFTARHPPSRFYSSFRAGGVKLDIRRLQPADVIAIALEPERQEQQNVRKLRGLDLGRWAELINLIDREGHGAAIEKIADLLQLDAAQQQVEALAARSNMVAIVRMLHDRHSRLMDLLLEALRQGKICVVDVSQLRGGPSRILSGLILRRIFDRNQEEFTSAKPDTIPAIAVIEEAQSVLNERSTTAEPFITWVKEGRKYDLGAVLVTQQPGSIPTEILSQGDNWFVFHLLSAADLQNLRSTNAHFSRDLLSSLLNEPIEGQGIFWTSAGGKPYPVALRALSFEQAYKPLDPTYSRDAVDTYASRLCNEYQRTLERDLVLVDPTADILMSVALDSNAAASPGADGSRADGQLDPLELLEQRAIHALRNDSELRDRIHGGGTAWGTIKAKFREIIPATFEDRDRRAFELVPVALNEVYGKRGVGWHTFRHPARNTTYVQEGPDAG
ncbi:MAG: ATP-binding protein [Thermomicrobiales bacterium]